MIIDLYKTKSMRLADLLGSNVSPPAPPPLPDVSVEPGAVRWIGGDPSPKKEVVEGKQVAPSAAPRVELPPTPQIPYEPAKIFDFRYFDGGKMGGGFGGASYFDFPCHIITAQHILALKPESVLELGAARGYVLKKLEDAGVRTIGYDVSKHCYLTRVTKSLKTCDLAQDFVWVAGEFDLAYSIGFFEHIPEHLIAGILDGLKRISKRGLHGIGCWDARPEECTDKTKLTLKPLAWWQEQFRNAGLEHHQVLHKDDLERGEFPREVLAGDGKRKINCGSFTTQFHYGWLNLDQHDLTGWSQNYGYQFQRCDVKLGLPFPTGCVDLIYSSHMLEHLSYEDGLAFLRECRRVIRPDGAMRLYVPDAFKLTRMYADPDGAYQPQNPITHLTDFDELNVTAANRPTDAGKLYSILCDQHVALYDSETLLLALQSAGWRAWEAGFRNMGQVPEGVTDQQRAGLQQILRETQDTLPDLSVYVCAVPQVG